MKKSLTILSAILITFISFKASAQDDKPQAKSYLSVFGGPSMPTGTFGSTSYSNNSSGFAKRGVTFGLDAGIYVYKNLAIGLTVGFQDQGQLTQADVQNLANGYNSSFIKDQTSVTAINRYHNLTLMAGPQYSFLIKNFTIDVRADAGLLRSTNTPSLTVVFDYSANSGQSFYQLSSGAMAFAYGGSAGVRYALSDTWDVGLKFNYIDCSGIKIGNDGSNTGATGRFQTNLPITVFQPTLGMAIKF